MAKIARKNAQKRKYPEIEPQFYKNDKGKIVEVYLPYNVYESIFEEIEDLKKQFKVKSRKSIKK